MRYSEILGRGFYQIGLPINVLALVDIHFAGASHHLYRYKEAKRTTPDLVDFHRYRHLAHLRHLMSLVYKYGQFVYAQDPSGLGLEHRESWNPDRRLIPDPCMFNSMVPDSRFHLGKEHASCDLFLKDMKHPVTEKKTNKQFLMLTLSGNS